MLDTSIRGWFVSATGTDAGKTIISRALTLASCSRGQSVAAIKPIETGCNPDPLDALCLARACGRPELANAAGLYRARPPLAPDAVARTLGIAPPDLARLTETTIGLCRTADLVLVEGAGGLLVPLAPDATMADFAKRLGLPLLLVAPDQLGVLSHTLTAYECALARGLTVAAVILNRITEEPPQSAETNHAILSERIDAPVLRFPWCADTDDAALARAIPSDWWPVLSPV